MRELHIVKIRHVLLFVAATALLAAGCGDDNDKADSKEKAKPAKMTPEQKVVEQKTKAVELAEKAREEKPKDANVCRDLGLKLVALASPESTGDPKKAPAIPKDREKNLNKATATLVECHTLAPKDDGITSMLASVYMATGKYKEASKLLEQLAKSSKNDANAYYAWGLAASNATDYPGAIAAWTQFAKLAPKNDPRVKQVNQSITALKAQMKAPKPKTTPAAAPSPADKADEEN